MLQSEFYERTGVTLTSDEYAEVEHLYNNVKMNKDEFCKQWLKLRNNKLFNEVAEGLLRRERELVEKVNKMYADINSLKSEYCEYRIEQAAELEQAQRRADERITDFAKRVVIANGDDACMLKEVERVVEEEFGYPFVIKSKHEAGIPLSNEEISYMVGKL